MPLDRAYFWASSVNPLQETTIPSSALVYSITERKLRIISNPIFFLRNIEVFTLYENTLLRVNHINRDIYLMVYFWILAERERSWIMTFLSSSAL